MFHKVFSPHPALKGFVNNIMIFDVSLDTSNERPILSVPPLPENCLFFYPFEAPEAHYLTINQKNGLPNCTIVGRQVNRIQLKMPLRNLVIKVGFQPGGLYRLLGTPLSELPFDEALESAYILDKDIRFITEQLQEATTYAQMFTIVEAFLLKKLSKLRSKLPIDSVFPLIVKMGGLISVKDIASKSCVSTRQLERQFQQRIGMSPKFFLRLTRFSKAWLMKENNPTWSWTTIAHQCGYFDQMHFIRDFKEFAGVTPSIIEAEFNAAPFKLQSQVYF